jgi:hypothetical protein
MVDIVFIPISCLIFDETTDKPVPQVDHGVVSEQYEKIYAAMSDTFKIQVDVLSHKDSEKSNSEIFVAALSGEPKQIMNARLWFLSAQGQQVETNVA